MIFEQFAVTASDTDLLAGGRLNSIPYGGTLTLRFLSDLNNASNNYVLTIQKPDGDVPVDGQRIPGQKDGTAGAMPDNEALQFTFPATQGGHFTISLTETGSTSAIVQAILKP